MPSKYEIGRYADRVLGADYCDEVVINLLDSLGIATQQHAFVRRYWYRRRRRHLPDAAELAWGDDQIIHDAINEINNATLDDRPPHTSWGFHEGDFGLWASPE